MYKNRQNCKNCISN